MKIYIAGYIMIWCLLTAGCKKRQWNYNQYYRVEYSNIGYRAVSTFMSDDRDQPAYAEVSMNGIERQGTHETWSGNGNPDIQFSAKLLSGKRVTNRIAYTDAPVYDVYIPDTFTRAKNGWFVFNQANKVSGENKHFWTGDFGSSLLYASYDTPNDTVWVPLSDAFYQVNKDSAYFQFGISKQMTLQQPDGDGGGFIEVWKVFGKWVRLVP